MSQILKQPAYRLHKVRNCAGVTLNAKNHYLGPWQSPESHEKYARLIAEWRRMNALQWRAARCGDCFENSAAEYEPAEHLHRCDRREPDCTKREKSKQNEGDSQHKKPTPTWANLLNACQWLTLRDHGAW